MKSQIIEEFDSPIAPKQNKRSRHNIKEILDKSDVDASRYRFQVQGEMSAFRDLTEDLNATDFAYAMKDFKSTQKKLPSHLS